MARAAKSSLGVSLPPLLVANPNLGLYLGEDSLAAPPQSLTVGQNVRIRNGSLECKNNLGWAKWSGTAKKLNGPVKLFDVFVTEANAIKYLFADNKDLYEYAPGADTLKYRTPIFDQGGSSSITSVTGSNVVGSGSKWANPQLVPIANTRRVIAGDQISFGSNTQDLLTATWFTITGVVDDTHLTVSGSPGAFSGAYTIRQVFDTTNSLPLGGFSFTSDTFTNADVHGDGTFYGNMWIAVHSGGVCFPFYMTSADTFAKYINKIPYIPRTFAIWKNMAIYGDLSSPVILGGDPVAITLLPTSILNTDVGRPQTFTGGLAGQFVALPGDTSSILCMHPLNDDLVIYSHEQVTGLTFTGDDTRFVLRTIIPDRGVLGRKLVVTHIDKHEFVSDDCLYWLNGNSALPSDQHVWRDVTKRIDYARIEDSFVFIDQLNGENVWAIGTTDDGGTGGHTPITAIVSHYLEGPGAEPGSLWALRSLPYTTRDFAQTTAGQWNTSLITPTQRSIAGNASGDFFIYGETSAMNGSAMAVTITFPMTLLGANRTRSLVRRVYPVTGLGTGNLSVSTRVCDQIAQTGSTTTLNYDLTQAASSKHFVAPYRRGRWAQITFSGTGAQNITLHGYDIDRVRGGEN